MMKRAAIRFDAVKEVNNKGQWKPTPESIESHATPEWFADAKFGMCIDWGLWSVAGWAADKKPTENGLTKKKECILTGMNIKCIPNSKIIMKRTGAVISNVMILFHFLKLINTSRESWLN